MNIIIFGPPGAGKGTQSEFIVKNFNLFKLSTGDLLRDEINKKTALGLKISSIVNSGSLVSDNIINNLIDLIEISRLSPPAVTLTVTLSMTLSVSLTVC